MKTKIHKALIACILFGGSMLVSSCFEEGYDINDVDYTVGTSMNLRFLIGNTAGIYLKNVIELEKDGVVKVMGDDTYCVSETGKADIPPIDIPEISIPSPRTEMNASLGLDNDASEVRGANANNAESSATEFSYKFKVGGEDHTIHAGTDGISELIKSITSVKCVENTFNLDAKISGFPDFVDKVRAKDLQLKLPQGLDFDKNSVRFMGISARVDENGVIYLTEEAGDGRTIDVNEGVADISLSIQFTGMTLGECFKFDSKERSVAIDGGFNISGEFCISLEKDVRRDALRKNANSATKADDFDFEDFASLMPDAIEYVGTAYFDENIVLTTFTGEVEHEVGEIAPIELNNLPDFLDDEEVVLDLRNPMIFITTKSEIPAEAKTSVTLFGVYKDKAEIKKEIGEITISGGSEKTTFCIVTDKKNVKLPQGYEEKDVEFIEVENLDELIYKIPEKIGVEIAPINMYANDVDITRDYNVDVDYEVFAPLSFGSDFNLVYRDTEDGLSEDLNDLEDIKELDGTIAIKAKVESDLETALTLSVIPLDKDKKEIKDLQAIAVEIPAKAKGEEIVITFKTLTEGKKMSDILLGRNGAKQLDGIRYVARMNKPIDGAVLKSNHGIRLYNMKLMLDAKASYDAN